MELEKQIELAQTFRDLHNESKMLILPNAWDVASALIFEQAGFHAIGTTSAGLAYSHGYPDGQNMTLEEVIYVERKMINRITVPLTVDMESGYGSNVNEVVQSVRSVIETGAVGINLEDVISIDKGLIPIKEQCIRIQALSDLKEELEIPFFLNARTDAFWLDTVDDDNRISTTIERCKKYIEAGADGVFIPGQLSHTTIQEILESITVPLNILSMPNNPSFSELQKLGVSRVSVGSGPVRAILGLTKKVATELFEELSTNSILNFSIPYEQSNQMFSQN